MTIKHLLWICAAVCLIVSAGLLWGDSRVGLGFSLAALVFALAGVPFARRRI
jgi:hypothetical protein